MLPMHDDLTAERAERGGGPVPAPESGGFSRPRLDQPGETPGSLVTEWLWDAGAATGVCPDRATAAARAEAFASPGSEAWVEMAVRVTRPDGGPMWLRTGTVHVGRRWPGGRMRWTQVLAGPPADR